MNDEQFTIGYDEFMPQPLEERRRIFSEVSADNCALLVRTHAERWLAANRHRLTHDQVGLVEEAIQFIKPELYREDRDEEKVYQAAEALFRRMEAIFSHEDLVQFMGPRADYVPSANR